MAMTQMGKIIAAAGLVLVVVGLALWGLGRMGFRGLPGDIRIEGRHTRIYFPIVTSLVLSAVLTLLLWLWHWFRGD